MFHFDMRLYIATLTQLLGQRHPFAGQQLFLALLIVAELVQHHFDLLVEATRLAIDDLLAQRVRRHLDHLLDAPE